MVLLPDPVSPTSAMLCPALTLRLKSSNTFSPSLYEKLTFLNTISPFISSSFPFGMKTSPVSLIPPCVFYFRFVSNRVKILSARPEKPEIHLISLLNPLLVRKTV